MKNYEVIIGIDISKLKLDTIGINSFNDIVLNHQIVDNSKTKIKSFFKKIIAKFGKDNIVVAFENTGVYGYYLASHLHNLGIDYYNLSALEVHRSTGIKRGKSDKLDAVTIAQYTLANRFKLELSSFTEEHILELKVLHTQREKIVKAIRTFNNNKETSLFLPKEVVTELNKTNNSIVNSLKKNLKRIDSQILDIIKSNNILIKQYELIQSVPGVGPQTATYLLIITKGFTTFKNARKLACYAGVAPFPYQSGSSIKGRNKVNHLADKKLKSLLNMCALNAKIYDYQLKKYFNDKVGDGKNKMLVLNNIRNKILHRVFAVIKRQQPYVNIHNFAA